MEHPVDELNLTGFMRHVTVLTTITYFVQHRIFLSRCNARACLLVIIKKELILSKISSNFLFTLIFQNNYGTATALVKKRFVLRPSVLFSSSGDAGYTAGEMEEKPPGIGGDAGACHSVERRNCQEGTPRGLSRSCCPVRFSKLTGTLPSWTTLASAQPQCSA